MKALILTSVWPEPGASAAGVRDQTLIRVLREKLGAEVVCASIARNLGRGAAEDTAPRDALTAQGVQTREIELNDSAFDDWVQELRPELVILDRFITEEQFGWRIEKACPAAVRVLDTQDLHWLRKAREKLHRAGGSLAQVCGLDFPPSEWRNDDALRELASIYRSDLTLMISDFEMDLLSGRFGVPSELLEYFPFAEELPTAGAGGWRVWPAWDERANFCAIGNFRHPPNADGVRWLHETLWPLIRARLPQAELHVYGAYPPREMMALDHPGTGFRVLGWTPDAVSTLQKYRVNLAPLRFGAGIKGKIAQGWRAGTPAVSTPIGAEGMRHPDESTLAPPEWGGRVESNSESFAQAAYSLYTDPALWKAAQSRGQDLFRARFDWETQATRLAARLESVVRDLGALRQRNLVGAMLRHHQHRSTEYFSRWIEAKNLSSRG